MEANRRIQLGCTYCGYAFLVLFCVGFVGVAGFVPPPSPSWSAGEVARFFRDDLVPIRIGLCVTVFASALLLPWGAAVSTQIKRVEGRCSPLTYTWIAATGCIVLEFIFPAMFWAAAAFRPDDAPELIRKINDLAWLPWLGIVSTGIVQALALAVVSFVDREPVPAYPRWFGYVQVFLALALAPADLDIFFKTGAFAWDGVVTFWLPVAAAVAWLAVTTAMTARAVTRQRRDDEPDLRDLATRVRALESRGADTTVPTSLQG